MKAPLSFATKMRRAWGAARPSRAVLHLMLAKPWSLLMSHLHLDSAPQWGPHVAGHPIGLDRISTSYDMRSLVRFCGTCLLVLPIGVLLLMSVTRSSFPHRPVGGLESRALNFLQTSCILHFP